MWQRSGADLMGLAEAGRTSQMTITSSPRVSETNHASRRQQQLAQSPVGELVGAVLLETGEARSSPTSPSRLRIPPDTRYHIAIVAREWCRTELAKQLRATHHGLEFPGTQARRDSSRCVTVLPEVPINLSTNICSSVASPLQTLTMPRA